MFPVVDGVFIHLLSPYKSLSEQCTIWWFVLRHRKHKPDFLANSQRSFMASFLQVSHLLIPCSPLQIKHSVLAPEIANVFLGGYFFFFNHFLLFDFGLNFPPSCLEFTVSEQPNAISLTWTSVSNHLSKYVRSTSFGCNSSFFLLHLSEIAFVFRKVAGHVPVLWTFHTNLANHSDPHQTQVS